MLLRWTSNHLLIAVPLLMLVVLQSPVSAATPSTTVGETATWTGTWQGHRLSVVVVARGHVIDSRTLNSSPWWQWGNTTSDAYLFTWSDDGLVDLIVDFSTSSDRTEARLYVPVLQSQRLAIEIGEGSYTLSADLLPSYVIWPSSGTWLEEGLPNFNLNATEYSLVTGMSNWTITVGSDTPGRPDWVVRRIIDDPDPAAGYSRFEAAVRKDPTVKFELAEPLMPSWPYLSAIDTEGHYGKVHPLFFDPEQRALGHNWAGFHIAGMYQINSITYPPYTNFESPFAFYRFDPEARLFPNLVIRSDIWPQGSEFGPLPHFEQRTAVRMTWTAREPNAWRYSISVTGNHRPDEQITIGDTEVNAMSYESYPGWITSHDWKAMTFVESVHGEPGSEGIYEYTVEDNYTVAEWVNGLRTIPPVEVEGTSEEIAGHPEWVSSISGMSPFDDYPLYHPQRLAPGFRGEYSFVYQRKPSLYLSGIDGRVHLMYAEGGGWKLDTHRVLRVEDRDGDGFIDSWIRERVQFDINTGPGDPILLQPELEEALYVIGERVLYVTPEHAELYKLDASPVAQALDVPVDEHTWNEFLDQVETVEQQDPEEMSTWLEGLQLTPLAVFEGQVSQVRPVEGGIRFVHAAESSTYVITAAEWMQVELATPHAVSAALTAPPLTARRPGYVTVQLQHHGNRDLTDATLEVVANSSSTGTTVIDTRKVSILAGQSIDIDIAWAPPSPEVWSLQAWMVDESRVELAVSTIQLQVGQPQIRPEVISAEGTSPQALALAVGLLVVAAVGAGLAGWRLLARERTEHDDVLA